MASWLIRLIILACTAVHLLGCAERFRNADAGRTASEIEAFYRENIKGKTAAQGAGLAAADAMVEDPSTDMFYAESYTDPGGSIAPMGPIEVVTPIDGIADLNLGVSLAQIQTIRVYFFEQIGADGRHNHAFVIYITKTGAASQPLIFAVANTSGGAEEESIVDGDGVFQVRFPIGNGKTLLLESDDTTDGELNDVVQFQLLIDDGQGDPYSIGQISSMVGFLSKN